MHVSSALVKGPSIKHYNIYYVITGHVCGSFLFVSKICVNATVKVVSAILPNISKINCLLCIAICSPNCVQIWKGRDQKTVFCRVRHKKTCFLIESFLYENKILRTHNFFCRNCNFLNATVLENSCLLH